jgi:holliday junction resolvase YEN1
MCSVFRELGPGKRISLSKLAVEKLVETGRPLRVAIDISIWQFQVQSAKGGTNPAIRTLFYRLIRLLGLGIQPIFVFDGPHKPAFKRNKRTGRTDGVATAMAKRLMRLFGFRIHDAPGEAEAECALLQLHGVVDAVFSEDVDTLMFGCTQTLRNWSAEGKGGSPTHVSLYNMKDIEAGSSRLDRYGMVLIALLSGGDYIPEGIPGFGIRLACEAARAGFGKSLCQIKASDKESMKAWREKLAHELRDNENRVFRTRHKAMNIPDNFPDVDVLRYYTHPVVSNVSYILSLKANDAAWNMAPDVTGLREFVAETFDWTLRTGALKLVRVLAPGLLVRRLIERGSLRPEKGSVERVEAAEGALVKEVFGRRSHFSTDATPELRVSYVPADIVGLDLKSEPQEILSFGRDGLALNSDDEGQMPHTTHSEIDSATSGAKKTFDPTVPDAVWIPETVAKLGVPLTVEDWEAARLKATPRRKGKMTKAKTKSNKQKEILSSDTLDNWVKVSKPKGGSSKTGGFLSTSSQSDAIQLPRLPLPRTLGQPNLLAVSEGQDRRPGPTVLTRSKQPKPASAVTPTGPWTIARSQAIRRIAEPGKSTETIIISSSPPSSPSATTRPSLNAQQAATNKKPAVYDVPSSPPTRLLTPRPRRSPAVVRKKKLQVPWRHEYQSLGLVQTSLDGYVMVSEDNGGELKRKPRELLSGPNGSQNDEHLSKDNQNPKSGSQPSSQHVSSVRDVVDELPETAPVGKKTRFLIPRSSAVGYFKAVDLDEDDAALLGEGGGVALRLSDISIIDMTTDDD